MEFKEAIKELSSKKSELDRKINSLINDFEKESGLLFDGLSTSEIDIKCHPYKIVTVSTQWNLDKLQKEISSI